jgi:hypothetical protein
VRRSGLARFECVGESVAISPPSQPAAEVSSRTGKVVEGPQAF